MRRGPAWPASGRRRVLRWRAGLRRGLRFPGPRVQGQPADQAERVDEVSEPDVGPEQEHQRQPDGQPPGRRGDVARRPDHQRDRDTQPGREQQADRDHVPGRAHRGEQVPGQQALGRGLVPGEAEREQHAVLHQGVRAPQRGQRGRRQRGDEDHDGDGRRRDEAARGPRAVAGGEHRGQDRDGEPGGGLQVAGDAQGDARADRRARQPARSGRGQAGRPAPGPAGSARAPAGRW